MTEVKTIDKKKKSPNIREKLVNIQSELKAPKGQRNSFGNYNYRSCEDILEAVKPILFKHGCAMVITDSIELVGDRIYCKASILLSDIESEESIITTAFARESETKKGMDESQITGAASSYARKYALNGLFLIDDTKDADSMDNRVQEVSQVMIDKLTKYGKYKEGMSYIEATEAGKEIKKGIEDGTINKLP